MNLFDLKIFFALLIFVVSVLAGCYPFKKRLSSAKGYDFPTGEALAAGVFLGAGLMHMLGDAASDFSDLGCSYPLPFLLCGCVFLLLLLLEHIGREVYEHRGDSSRSFAILAVIMLSIHSLLEGAALGLSESLSLTMMIFLAIIAHKWAASFSLSVQVNKSHLKLTASTLLFLVFAIMTPIGILIGSDVDHILGHNDFIEPIFSSLAAGTFLYLGTLHGLNRAVLVEKCCNLKHFSFVVFGFALMAVVAIWT